MEVLIIPDRGMCQHIQTVCICFTCLIYPCPVYGMRCGILISFSGFQQVWIVNITNGYECVFSQGRRVLQKHLCTSPES